MQMQKAALLAFSASLMLLAGCATPTQTDVGAVVVAPRLECPKPTQAVLQTPPKPAGYFQQSFLDYFAGSGEKPTR